MTIDRTDILAACGALAMVIGIGLVHPALILVAAGYAVLTYVSQRTV